MEPPVRTDSESVRDEKVKVLRAIPPLEPKNVVRGQFRGYRDENGVAPNSQVETFAAALQLEIDSSRWKVLGLHSTPVECPSFVDTIPTATQSRQGETREGGRCGEGLRV
jgi:hypothetical protein